jgi:cytochrome oxidase Cu insertion factor (SCO1/SenC/PrrC family)
MLAAGTLSCASAGSSNPKTQAAVGWQVGNTAPDFTLADLNGKPVSLHDLAGKPVMINFWASW